MKKSKACELKYGDIICVTYNDLYDTGDKYRAYGIFTRLDTEPLVERSIKMMVIYDEDPGDLRYECKENVTERPEVCNKISDNTLIRRIGKKRYLKFMAELL